LLYNQQIAESLRNTLNPPRWFWDFWREGDLEAFHFARDFLPTYFFSSLKSFRISFSRGGEKGGGTERVTEWCTILLQENDLSEKLIFLFDKQKQNILENPCFHLFIFVFSSKKLNLDGYDSVYGRITLQYKISLKP